MRPPFAYHWPTTVEEAYRILATDPGAVALAGGTDLMVHLCQATAEYRREMVGVLVRRGLERVRDGDPGPGGP